MSLDARIDIESDAVLADFIEDDAAPDPTERLHEAQRRHVMSRAVGELPSRERRIVQLRHGLVDGRSRSFREISVVLSLSAERVRQIEAKTVAELAASPDLQHLREMTD